MTEHEMFEEKFPVPSETVWSDHLSAYVQKNRRVLSAYDDLWQVWQAARATPALPHILQDIAENSVPLGAEFEAAMMKNLSSMYEYDGKPQALPQGGGGVD